MLTSACNLKQESIALPSLSRTWTFLMTSAKQKKRKWKSLQEIYQRPGRKCLSLDLGEMCHLDSEVAQGFFYIKIINSDGLKIRPNFTDFSVQSAHDQGHFQSIVKK